MRGRLGPTAMPDHSKTSRALDSDIDRPAPAGVNAPGFGSDVVADALRATHIPYIALNPGASYRGLHDSLVNYLGNEAPQMLLCLHEEAAIAIAHGYAKVTGKAMAAAVHSNVGLMHGTMAIFNAWCDRMPMVILGATGPVDAVKRRPWIDWIHTARDQGALVRGYTKWDDQPSFAGRRARGDAARQLDRQHRAARADLRQPRRRHAGGKARRSGRADRHRQRLHAADDRLPPIPASSRRRRRCCATPGIRSSSPAVARARSRAGTPRIQLAERLGAEVVTDLKVASSFPTDHPLHVGAPSMIAPAPEATEAIRKADVILSLDWLDPAGTFKNCRRRQAPR